MNTAIEPARTVLLGTRDVLERDNSMTMYKTNQSQAPYVTLRQEIDLLSRVYQDAGLDVCDAELAALADLASIYDSPWRHE